MHLEQTLCWHSWHWCRRFKNNMNLVFVQRKQRLPLTMSLLRSGGKLSSLARDKALRIWVSSECDKVRVGEAFSAWKKVKNVSKPLPKTRLCEKSSIETRWKEEVLFYNFQFTIKWPNIIIIAQDSFYKPKMTSPQIKRTIRMKKKNGKRIPMSWFTMNFH